MATVRFVQSLAAKTNSTALAQLAMQMASVVRVTDDPFAKATTHPLVSFGEDRRSATCPRHVSGCAMRGPRNVDPKLQKSSPDCPKR